MTTSPLRALGVLLSVTLVCAVLVSASAILLRPLQLEHELVKRYRNVAALTGLVAPDAELDDATVRDVVSHLDARVLDLETGTFVPDASPDDVDSRAAIEDPARSDPIPADADLARLGRRPREEVVYLVWVDGMLSRVILPIYGQGMWSTLYGLIALEADLDTIAAVTFYEQAETAGLGDRIEDKDWQAQWVGRRIYGTDGKVRFRVAGGRVDPGAPVAVHEVDGLSGATVTSNAVTALVRFWFGEHGYRPFLERLAAQPPSPPSRGRRT